MALPEGFAIRPATIADLEFLVLHRREMFRDMGYSDETVLNAMSERFRAWLLDHMNAGDYFAWLVCASDGAVVAGAGLWLMDWLPHMVGRGARRGNIVNVYTDPKFRRRGLARHVMEHILAWCRENGIDTVILHASPSGRSLYESMGFEPTNEMRLRF